ncbi:MAG: LamG-like jellyroll fold domain-containing protein, partial [Thermoleophilaceae bacterium]
MWRAALHASRAVATLAAFTIVTLAALALFAGAADARSKATAATDLPGALWGLEVDRRDVRRLGNRTLRRLRANGTNALIVERGSLRRSQLARLRRRAARQGLAVYVPFLEARPSSRRTADAATGRCRKLEVARPGSRCAVQARSRSSALRIARSGVADVVVVNVSGPGALRRLRGSHERIVAVARLGSRFRAGSWRRGLRAARGYDTVDLAVSWSRPRSLNRYLRLQDRFSRSRDEHAPTAPGRLEVAETLESSLSVTWRRSRDSKTVAGYGLYRGGEHLRDVAGTTATFKDLSCGRKYVFEVDAYDAHGNRSPKTAIRRSTATCAAGLVAAYSFDESGGGTVRDSAGGDDPGTLSGAARTSGRFGRALRFDGENDLVSIPDASRLDLTDKMTLEAWVKPSALGSSWRTVILKEQPDDLVYGLYANATGAAPSGHVYVGDDMRTKGMETLPVGAWTHLAATYDGSMLRLFVNGVESSNLAVDGRMASSSAPLRLGGNQVWDEWFDGVIDEVRIYSRALSPAEIQADMTTAVGEGTPADAEPPSSPSGLAVSAVTDSSLTLSWSSSSDNVAVSGYGLYRNGVSAGTTTLTSRTFTGLACGTAYTFAVDAYDAAGNRSAQASAAGTTLACPPPDTEAPTVPGAVAVTAVTDSSLTLSWSSSSDNVAVAGYGLYRDGASAGTTTLTSRTFGGLACGTTYTLA